MDKNLITLDELQLYVTSHGNTNNDKVKTFLNWVGMSAAFSRILIIQQKWSESSFKR